jgi:hypothetical protein
MCSRSFQRRVREDDFTMCHESAQQLAHPSIKNEQRHPQFRKIISDLRFHDSKDADCHHGMQSCLVEEYKHFRAMYRLPSSGLKSKLFMTTFKITQRENTPEDHSPYSCNYVSVCSSEAITHLV